MRLPVVERQQQGLASTPRQAQNLSNQMPMQDTSFVERADKYLADLEKIKEEQAKRARDLMLKKSQNMVDMARQKAEQKVLATRGENAFGAVDSSALKLRDDIETIKSSVAPEIRADLDLYTDKSYLQFDKTAIGHSMSEGKKIQDATYKTRNIYLTEAAARDAYDVDAFLDDLAEIDVNTEAFVLQTKGGLDGYVSPEVRLEIEASKLDARSTAVTKTVELLASQGDIKQAEFYATEFANTITPTDRIKINGLLKKGRADKEDNEVLGVVQAVLRASNYDQVLADTLLMDMVGDDLKRYNKAAPIVKAHIQNYKADEKAAFAEAKAIEMNKIRAGQMPNLKNVRVEDQNDVLDYLKRKNANQLNIRDPETYDQLYDLMINRPEVFYNPKLTNIMADYASGLDDSAINMFQREQQKGLDPQTKKYKINAVEPIIKRVIDLEVNAKHNPQSERKAYFNKAAAIRQIGMETLEDVKTSLGERASEAEIQRAFEKEFMFRTSKISTEGGDGFLTRTWKRLTGNGDSIVGPTTVAKPIENPAFKGYTNAQETELLKQFPEDEVNEVRAILTEAYGGTPPSRRELLGGLNVRRLQKEKEAQLRLQQQR